MRRIETRDQVGTTRKTRGPAQYSLGRVRDWRRARISARNAEHPAPRSKIGTVAVAVGACWAHLGSLPNLPRGHLICSHDSGGSKMIAFLVLGAWIAGLFAASAVPAQTTPFGLPKRDAAAARFSNIRLPQAVLANGKPVAAGTYQVRLTTERPAPAAGQSSSAECWVEFVKSGEVAGREVASVISAEDISAVA